MYIDIENTERTWQDVYKLAITFVTPRPIAFVSSLSVVGIRNLAPFSFFNMVSANPPVLIICPSRYRDGRKKDTLTNIEATGQFVVATVTQAMAEGMNQASADYPPDIDEFTAAGFTPAPASKVQPALVAESPVNCECVLDRIVDYGPHAGAGAVIFGRIVAIHVDDSFLAADGLMDDEKLQTIGRMGRLTYVRTSDRFDLPRPSAKGKQ
jgi:flavin reductase (DIM6/NTAB) family NADH-FMN oxidoreductase RutF